MDQRIVMKISKSFLVVLTFCLTVVGATAAQSGSREQTLLNSYVGNWRGESILVGSDKPDPFRCRLSVTEGKDAKINYSGRCTLITTTLSVNGTIAYVEENRRYEGAMSTNVGFTGLAVGIQRGDTISFNLKEKKKDRSGSDVRIGARLVLEGGTIVVYFEVEFNDSGNVMTADVPFAR
ncbi:hypothetical protein [uncultured Maritalea sp.]|uniref:hypothetical protein n=1 Tax=uncultured Maritalea sp. TaxID=757249 RepID=UPI002609D143|nr:hypothetical protein [uncultured Maritalea sp.]